MSIRLSACHGITQPTQAKLDRRSNLEFSFRTNAVELDICTAYKRILDFYKKYIHRNAKRVTTTKCPLIILALKASNSRFLLSLFTMSKVVIFRLFISFRNNFLFSIMAKL